MLKREYIRHIEEMTRRVRCEEWAELEKNKRDFIETGASARPAEPAGHGLL